VWCHAVQCKKVLYSKQCKTQLIAALSAVLVAVQCSAVQCIALLNTVQTQLIAALSAVLVASIQCKTQLIAALRAVLVVVQFSEQ